MSATRDSDSPRKLPRWLLPLILKMAVAVTLLGLLMQRVPFEEVMLRLREARWWLVVAFSPLLVLQILLLAWRWQILAKGLVSPTTAVKYTWIGLFYSAVLPGGVSGDIAKGAVLALKDKETRAASLPVSILVDRLVGLWSLLGLVALGGAWFIWTGGSEDARLLQALGWASAICLAGAVGGAGLASPPGRRLLLALSRRIKTGRFSKQWLGLWTALDSVAGEPRRLGQAALLSMATHLISVALYLVCLRAVGFSMPFVSALVLYAITSVLVTVPLTVSGIGVRDWFTVLFFEVIGLAGSTGLAFTWLNMACGFGFAAFGGLVQLWELFYTRPHNQTHVPHHD